MIALRSSAACWIAAAVAVAIAAVIALRPGPAPYARDVTAVVDARDVAGTIAHTDAVLDRERRERAAEERLRKLRSEGRLEVSCGTMLLAKHQHELSKTAEGRAELLLEFEGMVDAFPVDESRGPLGVFEQASTAAWVHAEARAIRARRAAADRAAAEERLRKLRSERDRLDGELLDYHREHQNDVLLDLPRHDAPR